MMAKEQFRESDTSMKVHRLRFGVLSPENVQRLSHVLCVTDKYYEPGSGAALRHGVLDTRMGAASSHSRCDTCGLDHDQCTGHFGRLELELPVFHPGYFEAVHSILRTVCKQCGRVLLPPGDRARCLDILRSPVLTGMNKKALHKRITDICRKQANCVHCGAANGVVRKCGFFKFHYDRTAVCNSGGLGDELLEEYDEARIYNSDLEFHLEKLTGDVLNAVTVLELFRRIPDEDLPLLVMECGNGRPEGLLLTSVPVPPLCVRPSVFDVSGRRSAEGDLTQMLSEIIKRNGEIRRELEQNRPWPIIMLRWEELQASCGLYLNGELPSLPASMQPRPVQGLVQRLKGKRGRFRGNLSGKRVDFSSRTVISPDPNLRIDEVGVPRHVAKILTYPERVTPHNLERLRQLVLNGSDTHPGANFLTKRGSESRKSLRFGNRVELARFLQRGDIVERHLCDGDVVLFNRQPSLHKLSVMAHFAKVLPHLTFRFNECVCTPYNADFDGDEMNLHVPQTEEARAEAMVLLSTRSNLVSPGNGEPLIAAIQDFITGGYLLTNKDVFLDRAKACHLAACVLAGKDTAMRIDLPPPAVRKPLCLWTGKQVFSLILRPNRSSDVLACLRAKGKSYTSGEEMCANDAYVLIRNSELLSGRMDKDTLGSGSKNNIFYNLLHDYGSRHAADAMWRLVRLSILYIQNQGFSIGIGDVTPSAALLRTKQNLVRSGYSRCEEYIDQLENGQLEAHPGCSEEETLEAVCLKELSSVRDHAGRACLRELHKTNSPLIMALCGSKGSVINISQMIACVGQQAISGHRVPNDFEDRSLPHFEKNDRSPQARGFVENSFYTGLTPIEFLFHTMAGREGLVDTAVKTAETGYMQRRLVKALEDLCVHYDGSVRNSYGDVVQFCFGGDGMDPSFVEANGDTPVDFDRVMELARARRPCKEEARLDMEGILSVSKQAVNEEKMQELPKDFRDSLEQYVLSYARAVDKVDEQRAIQGPDSSVLAQLHRLTETQLRDFLSTCREKFMRSLLEPGTAIGAVTAQSIGEPTTQMTLKTFHFAGVASMNITQGVPRIKEIVNASKNISTPVITAHLVNDRDEEFARRVKARIEKTVLGEVSEYLEEVLLPRECFVLVKLDLDRIRLLKLNVTAETVGNSIAQSKLRLPLPNIRKLGNAVVAVAPVLSPKFSASEALHTLMEELPSVVIAGIPTVPRAVIHADDSGRGPTRYKLLIEGEGLREVMSTYGVDGNRSVTNSVREAERTLGIEAARTTIVREIGLTMQSHGIRVDHRHLVLLADQMTFRGEVLGFTRDGLVRMRESSLMLASFEKTADHLFDAAYYGQVDEIVGVTESIIMGVPMDVGTGFFDLRHKVDWKPLAPPKKLGFDRAEFHLNICEP
ncbi:DNA-directed RNA polymerase III subunit RPC1-like [Haemaphysalis longicornis]